MKRLLFTSPAAKLFTALLIVVLFSSAACDKIDLTQPISEAEIAEGLRQALTVSADTSVSQTNKADGYFRNELIKILLPPEAAKVESTLRSIGAGALVDDLVLKLNRAAEDAAIEAKPIFVNAITGITITDASNILFGDSIAATTYLRGRTYVSLKNVFAPKVEKSLDKVGAVKIWEQVFTTYNSIPFVTKVNPDLKDYATGKALDGLFVMLSKEEKGIRKNPLDRVSALLQKVFGELDK
ncbi:MAG: DUF4197 domain-containing protein [Bacteroidota bacterium]|nr:DUF4197 domain-containing protein [Bacteroidota bacterium]